MKGKRRMRITAFFMCLTKQSPLPARSGDCFFFNLIYRWKKDESILTSFPKREITMTADVFQYRNTSCQTETSTEFPDVGCGTGACGDCNISTNCSPCCSMRFFVFDITFKLASALTCWLLSIIDIAATSI